MKKILYVLVGLFVVALIIGNGAKPPAKAVAAAPACVVDAQKFADIKEGMSRFQIERDIGCPGTSLSSNSVGRVETRVVAWKATGLVGGNVNAMFRNDILVGKGQFNTR